MSAAREDDGSVPSAVQLPSNVLYDDRYVQVTDTHVIIKNYYFFGCAKKIAYAEIERLYTAEEYGAGFWGQKIWGMGLSAIWWAWGFGCPLRPPHNFVIKVRDSCLCSGFSVQNPHRFNEHIASKGVIGAKKQEL